MIITPPAQPPRRDLTVVEGVMPQKLYILPGSRTRTGTPLTFEHGGWRPIKPDSKEQGLFFAAGPCEGGEHVMAFKAMIVDTHVQGFMVGRVRIFDIQDSGALQFTADPTGPYIAITPSRVLLG